MTLIPEQPYPVELGVARRPRNRARVVCLGGGTGLSTILRGLKKVANVTAVVTTTDDGGSSGRLRRDFGMPAPGDVRNCLSALAEDENLVGRLFEHRFTTGELAGHSFGNLFLAGLTDLLGSFDQAVSESARVLAVAGRVVPSTTDVVELVAQFADGHTVRGETALAADGGLCRSVQLDPPDPRAHPRALQAIERADLIVMGPGSLFTSTLPPLLIPGIREAVRMSRVPRIYVCNLLQQPGETEGYRASDHVARIFEHVGPDLVDGVLVSRNRAEHGTPVPVDRGGLRRLGLRVFGARLATEWQHDPDRLARSLVRLARWKRSDELR
ncbi:MAG: gluconeogenesis factor YvcK family protein [Gaiellales bacterium]